MLPRSSLALGPANRITGIDEALFARVLRSTNLLSLGPFFTDNLEVNWCYHVRQVGSERHLSQQPGVRHAADASTYDTAVGPSEIYNNRGANFIANSGPSRLVETAPRLLVWAWLGRHRTQRAVASSSFKIHTFTTSQPSERPHPLSRDSFLLQSFKSSEFCDEPFSRGRFFCQPLTSDFLVASPSLLAPDEPSIAVVHHYPNTATSANPQPKMPAARKRSSQELGFDDTQEPAPPSMLHRIRNMWQFANLFQFILLFGHALKLDDNLDIEVRRILPLPRSGFTVPQGKPRAHMRAAVGPGSGMPQAGVHGTSGYWPWTAQVSVFTPRPHVRFAPFLHGYPLVWAPCSHRTVTSCSTNTRGGNFSARPPRRTPLGAPRPPSSSPSSMSSPRYCCTADPFAAVLTLTEHRT